MRKLRFIPPRSSAALPGKIVDSFARDTRPELFPSSDQPLSLDHEPPKVTISFVGAHRGSRQFAEMNGDVSFDVEAHDDSGIHEIKLLEPKLANVPGHNFGPIADDFLPQAAKAAHACGKADFLRDEIKKRELAAENIICACFEAVDVFENSAREMSCFQRAAPKVQIVFPANNTVISSKNFNDGVKLKATVSNGMPLKGCSWRIEPFQEPLVGNGVIEGSHCVIDNAIDGEHFSDGNYAFVVTADDIGGRTTNSRVDFRVMTEPPAIEIISPGDKGYIANDFISVTGKVADARLINEIIVSFNGAGEANHEFTGSANATMHTERNEWSVILGEHLSPGLYAYHVLVKDIYGNEKVLPSREVIIDNVQPIVLGALDGVVQNSYVQERETFRQRIINAETKPRYIIEPVGDATPLAWATPPVIHRWRGRIDDRATAPSYVFKASDNNKMKQISYRIDNTCAGAHEADEIVISENDLHEIRFTQSAARVDLTNPWQNLCLSIWAFDEAGNKANHVLEFSWTPVASPIALDMNTARYQAHLREDDISWVGQPVGQLFRGVDPVTLKKNLVVGHLIVANPFPSPVAIGLDLKKALALKINQCHCGLPENVINIRYFTYDVAKNEVGTEKAINNATAKINGHETIVAKFVLAHEISICNIRKPKDDFWQSFSLELDFFKSGNGNSIVEGLSVITRDPHGSTKWNELTIPWGDHHDARRRSTARQGL